MKMLIIYLGVFPKVGKFVSGGERHFIEVCKRWVSRGHEIHVLTTDIGAHILKINNLFVKTFVLNVPYEDILCKSSLGIGIFYNLRVLKAYILLLTHDLNRKYDIICTITHLVHDVIPGILISKRNNGSKVVVYVHGPLAPPPLARGSYHNLLPSFLYWLSEQLSLKIVKRYADLIFATPIVKEELIKMGSGEERIELIHNFVDFTYIQHARPACHDYDACFLGRMTPAKGIFDLIDIWSKVRKEIPEAKIAIIGGGQQRYMKKIKKASSKHNIVYIGPVDEYKKFALLKSAKVFAYPSYEESWGIVVCEAMACGLPVVVYNLPAYRYVFKKGIVTVPIGDKKRLAATIIKILKNDDVKRKLSEEAKVQAEEYDLDSMAFKELKFIESLVDEG